MITEKYFAKSRANVQIPPPYVFGKPASTPAPSPAPASSTINPHGLSMKEIAQATKMKITLEEYSRRNKLVREAWLHCPFHVGEVVEPRQPHNLGEYGKCRIVGIAKDYYEYGGVDQDWDNVVRILTFEPVDPKTDQINRHYHATVNWFKQKATDCGATC